VLGSAVTPFTSGIEGVMVPIGVTIGVMVSVPVGVKVSVGVGVSVMI
jgi:hypothetical protein